MTPIRGAPRTIIVRIATAASSSVARRLNSNAKGRRVWSMTWTLTPSGSGKIVR